MTDETNNGTSGNDTIVLDSQNYYTVFAGAVNDVIKANYTILIGGTYIGQAQTLYGGDGTDTFELVKANQ